jgi:purine-binding chemotaxis protein CheW
MAGERMNPSDEGRGPAVVEGSWDVLARNAARREPDDEAELLHEFVAFALGDEPYALPVERVREIVRLRPITPVPRVPSSVLGVISLRGEIVLVVDLRRRLGMSPTDPTRKSRVIVLHGDDGAVTGLLVDGVREVLRLTEADFRPAVGGEADAVTCLLAREQQFVSLLDIDRVLGFDDE